MPDQQNRNPPPQPANDNNNKILELEAKIKALEEYCLNVDYVRIPPPAELQYLFVKTQGTCQVFDDNPANNGLDTQNYSYQGEMIKGKPSGRGKIFYNNDLYYEGEFLNGKKHGSGVFSRANNNGGGNPGSKQLTGNFLQDIGQLLQGLVVNANFKEDQRYIHGVKDGIFCTTHGDDRKFYEVYEGNKKQHCTKRVFPNGVWGYYDQQNDLQHGHDMIISPDNKLITVTYHMNDTEIDKKHYAIVS